MSQQQGGLNRADKIGSIGAPRWKQYAAGGPYDLVADGGNGQCCRSISFLASGDLTHCLQSDGTTDRPITAAPAGFVANVQATSISPTVAVLVCW